MGNVARKIQENQQKQHQVTTQTVTRAIRITLGEKFLFGLLIVGSVVASTFFISNKYELYKVNGELTNIEAEVKNQEKVNKELKMEVEALTRSEDVIKKAKEKGLKLDPNNIKNLE
ncbi:cell division protein FtsL [Priestia taiwanensis]|uniref:Cell division protein FtsL n=1 Tax=Priestia taiwanensis TaxID=1347902 RepID=A0A917AS59_9BACI|nr:cell division protein FtsL [Priestia taiwanensis]MBM7362941.1 cell division protein FtsL [Priestia taiwanensis]GGE66327.1 cell division protein FtsL [Priestia taiwanensis]